MKCYCGTIITVNANDDVVRYLVEDKGKIIYVGNELPKQYQNAEIIDLKESTDSCFCGHAPAFCFFFYLP